MTTFLWIAIPVLLILSIYAFVVNRSPEGYEDEKGFHFGKKE